jgi:regulator of sigma E protease
LAAGPIANFLLAIVIMTFWFMLVGKAVTEPRVAGVSKDSAAEEAGFKPDDLVLKIDGQEIYSFEELQRIIALSANTPLNVLVERDGKHLLLKAAPRLVEREDHSRVGRLGIYASPPRVVKVEPGSAAEKAGIKAGDDVLQINSGDVESFADIQEAAAENPGKPLELIVSRDGRQLTLPVTPEAQDREINGEVVKVGVLGIQMERKGRVYERLYPPQAFLMALSETWFGIKLPVIFIQKLLTGEASGKEVRGILGIAQLSHDVAQANPWNIFQLLAFISIQIGLLNLFPIPILDGGHLLFYGIEAIRGRPLSERAMEISFRIGFALVIMLMLFATRNDVIHLLRMFRHTE